MALQKTILFDTGVTVTDAYARIDNVVTVHPEAVGSPVGSPLDPRNSHEVNVKIYKDRDTFIGGAPPIKILTFDYKFNPSDDFSLQGLYDRLKLETIFSGASDV